MFIQKLGLKNFKCFKEVEVDFSKITLLTGENSSGKSSLIYGILTPLQSLNWNGESFPLYLSLNGKYVEMGGYEDISFQHTNTNEIHINLDLKKENRPYSIKTSWVFNKSKKSIELNSLVSNVLHGKNIEISKNNSLYNVKIYFSDMKIIDKQLESFQDVEAPLYFKAAMGHGQIADFSFDIPSDFVSLFLTQMRLNSSFNFLSSFRLCPERTYYHSNTSNQIDKFGNGYIDQILKWNDTQSEELTRLVGILKELGMVYDIKPHRLSGGRFEIKVKVKKQSKWESLADVGFGTSQFMPIIVADLQLSDESTLIMCQPEIHLHPSVQASLGDYLVKQVNEKKKQYIVETHSEYLLNRIRLLIVKGEVEPEDVAVYYFENSIKEGSIAHRIEFTKDGQILNAPRGFFETYMIDTMDIALNA